MISTQYNLNFILLASSFLISEVLLVLVILSQPDLTLSLCIIFSLTVFMYFFFRAVSPGRKKTTPLKQKNVVILFFSFLISEALLMCFIFIFSQISLALPFCTFLGLYATMYFLSVHLGGRREKQLTNSS